MLSSEIAYRFCPDFDDGYDKTAFGERLLWRAVLLNAMIVLQRSKRPGIRMEAIQWFYSQNYHVGSFRWVCDILGLEKGHIRAAIPKIVSGEIAIDEIDTRPMPHGLARRSRH